MLSFVKLNRQLLVEAKATLTLALVLLDSKKTAIIVSFRWTQPPYVKQCMHDPGYLNLSSNI